MKTQPTKRYSKEEVDYGVGKSIQRCALCVHFQPKTKTCETVIGPINPVGWCQLFERNPTFLYKFNQEHDDHGRFSGPGGSHDPTGNPRGRPATGAQPAPGGAAPESLARSASVAGGSAVGSLGGDFVGAQIGRAAGAVLGTEIPIPILGTVTGAWAGEKAGALLGSLAGDYVGAKIGATLYDLKQRMDGHPVGAGKIGELSPGDQAAFVGSFLGGTGAYLAFGGKAGSYATSLAQRYLGVGERGAQMAASVGRQAVDEAGGAAGNIAGRVSEGKVAQHRNKKDDQGSGGVPMGPGHLARGAASAAGAKAHGASFAHAVGMGMAHGIFGKALAKPDMEADMKADTTSFASLATGQMPRLFGPKAWDKVKDTPFGAYVRQRVKETAEQLDDQAHVHDMGLKPSKQTAGMMAASHIQVAHMHSQNMVPIGQADPAMGGGGAPGQEQPGQSAPPGAGGSMGGGKPPPQPVQKLFRPQLFRKSGWSDAAREAARLARQAMSGKKVVPLHHMREARQQDMKAKITDLVNAHFPGFNPDESFADAVKRTTETTVAAVRGQKAGERRRAFQVVNKERALVYMRDSSDAYYGDKRPGNQNARQLTQMDAMDRATRNAQLRNVYARPALSSLNPGPNEDEVSYRKRILQVMREGERTEDKGRPNLFNGGQSTLYRVRQVRKSKVETDPGFAPFKIEAEIAKGLNPQITLDKGLIYGWASVIEKDGQTVTDHQGDRISPDALVDAAHDFVSNSRTGGVLHDETGHKIGHIVESMVFTKDLQTHLGIDLDKVGWLIGYKVEDPRVKAMVKAGILKSFSIGGRGHREPVDGD